MGENWADITPLCRTHTHTHTTAAIENAPPSVRARGRRAKLALCSSLRPEPRRSHCQAASFNFFGPVGGGGSEAGGREGEGGGRRGGGTGRRGRAGPGGRPCYAPWAPPPGAANRASGDTLKRRQRERKEARDAAALFGGGSQLRRRLLRGRPPRDAAFPSGKGVPG